VGDAFRVASRARGEGHAHDLVGSQDLRHERREGALAGEHRVQGDGVRRARAAEDTDGLEIGEMWTEFPNHRDIFKTLKRHGAHEGATLREA
jgi:hypothetical protein